MNKILKENISLLTPISNYSSYQHANLILHSFKISIEHMKNVIKYSYDNSSIIYEYLQKIKEIMDEFSESDIDIVHFYNNLGLSSLNIKEIDCVINQATYNNYNVIVTKDMEQKTIPFTISISNNTYFNIYNSYVFSLPNNKKDIIFNCPILDTFTLDIHYLKEINKMKHYQIQCKIKDRTISPKTIIKISDNDITNEFSYGIITKIIYDEDDIYNIYITVFNDFHLINKNSKIYDTNNELLLEVINEPIIYINNYVSEITEEIVKFIQNSIDLALVQVENELKLIESYVYIVELYENILKTYDKRQKMICKLDKII